MHTGTLKYPLFTHLPSTHFPVAPANRIPLLHFLNLWTLHIFLNPVILTYINCLICQRGPADTQHIDPEFTREMVPSSVSRTPEFNASTSSSNAFNGFSFVATDDSFLWGGSWLFKCLNSGNGLIEILAYHCRNPTCCLSFSTTEGISWGSSREGAHLRSGQLRLKYVKLFFLHDAVQIIFIPLICNGIKRLELYKRCVL